MRITERHERANKAVLKCLNFARNQGISIASIVSGVALASLPFLHIEPRQLWWTAFIIAALLTVSSNVAALFRDRSFEKLELVNKTSEQAVKVLLEDVGKRILTNLSVDNECSRITFYGKSDAGFVPLARYSRNPNYMHTGRKLYPDGQGAIWDAWEHGRAFDKTRNKMRERLIDWHESKNIPRTVVENFNMLPRTLIGLRLEKDRPLGVVIVESTDQLQDQLVNDLETQHALDPVLPVLQTLHPVFSEIAG